MCGSQVMPIVLRRICPSGLRFATSPLWLWLCLIHVLLINLPIPDEVQEVIGSVCMRSIVPVLCHASLPQFCSNIWTRLYPTCGGMTSIPIYPCPSSNSWTACDDALVCGGACCVLPSAMSMPFWVSRSNVGVRCCALRSDVLTVLCDHFFGWSRC